MLNIRALLGDLGVPYFTSGKNVSEGWTTIQCPMGCGDTSNHGGFAPGGFGYSCFKCGKHSIYSVIGQFTESRNEAVSLIKEYSNDLVYHAHIHEERASKVDWPPISAKETLPSIHSEYIHSRGYDPKKLREMYGVVGCYHTGPMKYRLVIPIFENGRLVSYVGRDVTEQAPLRYKNLPERQSILSVRETVYNIDSIHKFAIITEGIFDAWRFGAHGTALYGLQVTSRQVHLLAKKIKYAAIMFDRGTTEYAMAENLAESLGLCGIETAIVQIDCKDPGVMPQNEADELKNEIMSAFGLH